MRHAFVTLATALVVIGSLVPAASAADKIRVVATIPDLKALTDEVGGDFVEVESLARGTQNAHELEIRPSLMLKLRRADLLIENGLELDSWAEVAVQGANNPKIVRGAPGRIDASRGVHPLGNPHYSLDPGMAPIITQNIVEGLARLAPDQRAAFEKNRQDFLARLNEAMARWTRMLEPVRGAKVVVYHPQWIYVLNRFGLVQAATLEDRPGIPASPAHLAHVIRQMKEERIRVLIVEPWNDVKLATRVADEAGAKAVVLASMVGGVKGTDSYIAALDHNVNALAQALR
jgi:ABC-type Zn uptake system ZnuABC Zn-binding protein ZnuA